jgi:aminoglycoside phosphotransferase (APT) family kinase protein
MQRSSRDLGELRDKLTRWLAVRLGEGSVPVVSEVSTPATTGMSSESLLFEASWRDGPTRHAGSFVARVAPDPGDVPVFPKYDLELQYKVLQLVGEQSDVPVPRVRWLELDESHLGAAFFVMDRVAGRVPPDVMPYTMGSWLFDADPADQRRLQDATVAILASLHSIDIDAHDTKFLALDVPGETALRRHVESQRRYYDWVRGERRFPLLERAFDWLQENWPADEGPTVVSWGDSRIGNVLYDGFVPVAVLDWEMAALGPPGIDLGWCIFIHDFFEDITHRVGMPGMPHFMRREDVVATYEKHSGRRLPDVRFFEIYAALRHGIVMTRVHARRVHFEGAEWPEDLDAAIMHREVLEQMLEGKFPR